MTGNQKRLQFIAEALLLFVATIATLLCLERFHAIEFSVEKFAGFSYSPIGLNGYMVILLACFLLIHVFALNSGIFRPHPWTRWELLRRVTPLVIVFACMVGVFAYLHSGLAMIVWRHYP